MAVAASVTVDGIELAQLREAARADIIRLASEFTGEYREIASPANPAAPLVLSGHQPALYHPGVWFKNFLIDQIAAESGGTAINVIVDNDVAPAPSIVALAGTPDEPRPTRIAYDEPGPRLPWEMTTIQSMETLRSFADRTAAELAPFMDKPAITSFWPDVLSAVEAGKPLGLAFSEARNRLEADCGLNVLDVPLSRLCQTEWFLRVMLSILKRARDYRTIYNECVERYRQVHHIRSTSHPVPNLEVSDEATEVPFWIWTNDNPQRRPLWVSQNADGLRLTDRSGWQSEPIQDATDTRQLALLAEQGIYLRPRALATTTVLRLAAADLFIHGIGGAKYDQVTDEIIRRFYGFEPPRYVTATASAWLPVPRPDVSESDLKQIDRRLRDAEFNPERAVEEGVIHDPEWNLLLKQKSELLNNIPTFPEKSSWHQQLQDLNAKLRVRIAEPVARLRIERQLVAQQLQQRHLLASREYPVILFPERGLRKLLLDLAVKHL
ncbi:hypothetical protein [Blastopirellula marina]|uniref:Uncharacterized protein n=1 Tax=Blastopirellula marina TaxID=124 RepID=A0A2S8GQ00_9BACT|nr:hypothetical protein [Blastopirellula marina]PQO46492.1 hypothetical protein C5Y93_08435 [Blastopirellula marina]